MLQQMSGLTWAHVSVGSCLWVTHNTHIISHVINGQNQHILTFCVPLLCAVLYEIYRPDNKPLTLMLPVNTSVQDVMSAVVKPGGDHILVKMNSAGGETHLTIYISFKSPVHVKQFGIEHSELLMQFPCQPESCSLIFYHPLSVHYAEN